MSDEKLPPGWVRLTMPGNEGAVVLSCGSLIAVRSGFEDGAEVYAADSEVAWSVAESPAEVLSRIAEAQRAQRRFDALQGMAAKITAGVLAYEGGAGWRDGDAERIDGIVTALLDAIEAREAGR